MNPLLLSPTQAAAALGISRSKLYQLIGSGEIETVKLGRSRKIAPEALEAFVAQLRRKQRVKVPA